MERPNDLSQPLLRLDTIWYYPGIRAGFLSSNFPKQNPIRICFQKITGKAGKTGIIWKGWNFNKEQHIWKASHTNIRILFLEMMEIPKIARKQRLEILEKRWSIRTTLESFEHVDENATRAILDNISSWECGNKQCRPSLWNRDVVLLYVYEVCTRHMIFQLIWPRVVTCRTRYVAMYFSTSE